MLLLLGTVATLPLHVVQVQGPRPPQELLCMQSLNGLAPGFSAGGSEAQLPGASAGPEAQVDGLVEPVS